MLSFWSSSSFIIPESLPDSPSMWTPTGAPLIRRPVEPEKRPEPRDCESFRVIQVVRAAAGSWTGPAAAFRGRRRHVVNHSLLSFWC